MNIYKIGFKLAPSKLNNLLDICLRHREIYIHSPIELPDDLSLRFARIKLEEAIKCRFKGDGLRSILTWELGEDNDLKVMKGRFEDSHEAPETLLTFDTPVKVSEESINIYNHWNWIINPLSLWGKFEISCELTPPFKIIEDVKVNFNLYLNNGSFDQEEEIEDTGKLITGELFYNSTLRNIQINLDEGFEEYAPMFELGAVKTYLKSELVYPLEACVGEEDMGIFEFNDSPSQNEDLAALHLQHY